MKYLTLLFFIMTTLLSSITFAQNLESYLTFGGEYQDRAHGFEKAPNGDLYVVGSATNMTNFNPNGIPSVITTPPPPATNAFITKYNSDMTLAWLVSFSGYASHLILDDSLNVYVFGFGSGDVDFDPSSEVVNLWGPESEGYFIAKYGSDGAFKGAAQIETEFFYYIDVHNTRIDRLFKDHLDYYYVNLGHTINKYNSSLDLIWSQEIGVNAQIVNNSEIYSLRPVQHFIDIDDHKIVLVKNSTETGVLIDTSIYADCAGLLTIDYLKKINNDDLLIHGHYWGDIEFYGGSNTVEFENYSYAEGGVNKEDHAFFCRYDTLGNLLWVKIIDGVSCRPDMIEIDQDGNIYLIGTIYGPANYSSDIPIIHTSNNGIMSYIAKYDSEFNYVAMSQVLGDHSYILDFEIYGDTLYMSGSFYNPIDIDISSSSEEVLETTNSYDLFLSRYSEFDITENSIDIQEYDLKVVNTHIYSEKKGSIVNIIINEPSNASSVNEVSVYNMNGDLMTLINSNQNNMRIELSEYPRAVYLIKVSNEQGTTIEKVVKY